VVAPYLKLTKRKEQLDYGCAVEEGVFGADKGSIQACREAG
jgi:hypothetical protein